MPKKTLSPKLRLLRDNIEKELEKTIEKGACIQYSQLAENLGGYAPDSKYIALCLGRLQDSDTKNKRPLRSALVVRKDTGRPGSGFFDYAVFLGYKFRDKERFWREQIRGLIGSNVTIPI